MLVKLSQWLIGFILFEFKNGFCIPFINECYQRKINIENIVIANNTITGKCSPKDYLKINRIAKCHGGNIRIIRKCGLPFLLNPLKARAGFSAGIVLFIAIISTMSGFVWSIEINGSNEIEDRQVITFLDSQGFRIGSFWRSVNKDKIEDTMMATFNNLAWVHINRFGTTAKIELQEAEPKPNIEDKTITNLTSTKDGEIIYIMVRDGWQEVQVGDNVTKGQVLVSGINEVEREKENFYTHASGDIIARVKEPIKLAVNREQTRKSYSSPKTFKAISFFSIYLPLYIGKIPTINTEISKKAKYISINNYQIPIGIITTTVKPYTIYTKTLSDKELIKLTKNLVNQKLIATYKKENIISKDFTISLNGNSATAKGTAIVIENIGKEVPIFKNKDKILD